MLVGEYFQEQLLLYLSVLRYSCPVFISLPHIGDQGEATIKKTAKRLSKLMKKEENVIFKVFLQMTKVAFFTSNKDRTPFLTSSCVI